jgi:hypothetical protein
VVFSLEHRLKLSAWIGLIISAVLHLRKTVIRDFVMVPEGRVKVVKHARSVFITHLRYA